MKNETTVSSFSVSANTTAVSFASVLLLLLLLRRDMHSYSLVEVVLLLVLRTKSVLKQREVPATVWSFYVAVLYTAMLWTSIVAAVVLGCFNFCPLDCDASADLKNIKVAHLLRVVQQNGIYTYLMRIYYSCTDIFLFIYRLMRYTDICFFLPSGVLFPRE